MSDISNRFKVIHEIVGERGATENQELSAYLYAGWVLVDIHQRDLLDSQTGEPQKVTVYIVGHIDPQVVHPTWDDTPS